MNLHPSQSTIATFDELYKWVIWQFPLEQAEINGNLGWYGAVHPPLANHGWYPALIEPQTLHVHLYAHLEQTFPSPETAAEFMKSHTNP